MVCRGGFLLSGTVSDLHPPVQLQVFYPVGELGCAHRKGKFRTGRSEAHGGFFVGRCIEKIVFNGCRPLEKTGCLEITGNVGRAEFRVILRAPE